MTIRSRGLNGRFISCPATASRRESLRNKIDHQRAYILRRARERKRISASFIKAFAVKGQNKTEHWILGSKTNSLLFSLMESLIADRYLDPRQARLAIAKRIYFRGHPSSCRKRLPRTGAYDASRPEDKTERVSAFLGWPFPNPTNIVEMDSVDIWLNRYELKLKVGVEDARVICFNLFSRYKTLPGRWMYMGYPSSRISIIRAHLSEEFDKKKACAQDIYSEREEEDCNREPFIPDSEELHIQQDALIKGYKEMMSVAKNDSYCRSLLLVLNPSYEVRLDLLCAAWMHQFTERAPSANWCGLLKGIFEYCRFVEQRDLINAKCVQLREDLANQLNMFKLIRLSAGLPLFEGSTSLIDKVFLRSRSI